MRDVLAAFSAGLRPSGNGWTARCPAHDDRRSSLSIARGDTGCWLLKCFAGCALEAILAAAHLEPADLRAPSASSDPGRTIVATFDYRDETGTLLYQVVRFEPKDFRQRAAGGSWSVKGIRRVPYRLADLLGKKTVLVVEGEKDADRLWALGIPATTNSGGAGKWRPEFAKLLKAAGCQHVVILPDNDPPGAGHGRDVARSCVAASLEVKLIPLPDLPDKGDVSDYLAGQSKDELLAITRDAPIFDPQRSLTAPVPLALTSLADFLKEPDDVRDRDVVKDRISDRSRARSSTRAPTRRRRAGMSRTRTCSSTTGSAAPSSPTGPASCG